MFKKMSIEKAVNWSIPFISLFSSFMHLLYNLSNKSIFAAIISPINESVWEHLKMPVLPTIIWSIISFYILRKNYNIVFKKWLYSSIISIFICISFIVVFYYTYTGALGIHSIVLDILSLIISVVIGQFGALRIYNLKTITNKQYFIIFSLFIFLVTAFILFTFKAPHLPIFKDITGNYGL